MTYWPRFFLTLGVVSAAVGVGFVVVVAAVTGWPVL